MARSGKRGGHLRSSNRAESLAQGTTVGARAIRHVAILAGTIRDPMLITHISISIIDKSSHSKKLRFL